MTLRSILRDLRYLGIEVLNTVVPTTLQRSRYLPVGSAERLAAAEAETEVWEPDPAQVALQELQDSSWPFGKDYDGWPHAELARIAHADALRDPADRWDTKTPAGSGLVEESPAGVSDVAAPPPAGNILPLSDLCHGFGGGSPIPDGIPVLPYRPPLTEADVRAIVRDEVDNVLSEMATQALAALKETESSDR